MSGDGEPRRGLARGLSALLGDVDVKAEGSAAPGAAPIEWLRPSRVQPRRRFAEADIAELAESVRAKGVLQPILVRKDPDNSNRYEIIAGERRWRAAQRAGLHRVPVIERDLSDAEALEVALVENVQRADLTPLEEAQAYRRLIDEFGHGQEALAGIVGKSRSHVANTLRLLALPEAVKAMLDDGRLSAGHGRALLAADDAVALAAFVVGRALNVRQTEALVKKPARKAKSAAPKSADTRALERGLTDRLGLPVAIDHRGPGGTLTVRYRSLAQLDTVLRRLGEGE